MNCLIQKSTSTDASAIAAMASHIWHSCTVEELTAEFKSIISEPECGVFLAITENTPVGFAQCSLRHDYVEGTSGNPVGYLEGIYVDPAYRKRGVATLLLHSCEYWAREQGCTEFASDCELGNTDSLHFHLNVGFVEANRIICFTKKL